MKEKLYTNCLRCNRPLKTIESKRRGYGYSCWKLFLKESDKSQKTLFDMVDLHKESEKKDE